MYGTHELGDESKKMNIFVLPSHGAENEKEI